MDEPIRKRRWGRRVIILLAVIIVPLVVGYFVATSESFFKKIILPRASKSLNAKITVADASIRPFSQVILRGVKVETTGREPLATIQEARVRHSLTDIIRGNIKVDEITAVSPVIHVVTNPDGTSNLDPFLKPKKAAKPEKPPTKKPGKPPQLDIAQIKIENGLLRSTDRAGQTTEVSKLNVTIANVKNGGSGSFDLSGRVRAQREAGLQGKLKFALGKDLQPESLNGTASLAVSIAPGPMPELAAMVAQLTCDITPTEVKQVALVFQKNQRPLGELRAYGPFSVAKQEGRLNVEMLGIDKQVLALVGARLGMDFGGTKINSTNVIQLARGGNQISAAGGLAVSEFSITRTNQSTPTVNLDLNYSAEVDRGAKTAELEKFQLAGTQNQKPLVTASLTQPMSVAWGGTSTGVPDSSLKLAITGFSFADWKALLGEVPTGNLNANMELQSRESGKLLALKGDAEVAGLILNDPDKRKLMTPLEAKVRIDSSWREKVIELTQLAVALTPTQLAKNEANLKGRIDLSRAKATTGKLELFSEALDLTGYYELFAGDEEKKEKKSKQPAPPTAPAPAPKTTPAKTELPFKDFVMDARIGHVYLRELHLSNVVTGVKLDGAHLDLKPISLALNGAPVNGTMALDLGVPGYGYDVAMKMVSVPLAPIANSFMTEYRGRAKGDLNADLHIKGVGTTGTSLQKTLQGQITATCTNGHIQLAGKNMRRILDRVSAVLRVPELRSAPLTAFATDIGLGAGKIQIKNLDLVSEAFMAHSAGAIPIAAVLTNSPIPKLPVTFSLLRTYAEKANLMAPNAPTNTAYVPLPPFLNLTGTVGKPDADLNEGVILALAARSQAGRIGGEAGKVVQGALDTILGGGTNTSSTNKPNPLDFLLKKKTK